MRNQGSAPTEGSDNGNQPITPCPLTPVPCPLTPVPFKPMKYSLPIVLLLLVFASFKSDQPFVSENDHLTMAVLYHQKAPEYRALCYQAYNLATVRLQHIVKRKGNPENLAVVLDLDETVLDNSPYEAECILENINYPERWNEWCEKASAEAVPGAVEFIKLANSLGVQIIFISNRKGEFRNATMANLASIGIPEFRNEHLLLRDTMTQKESRRQLVSGKFEIVLLIGDNLNDFSDVFEITRGKERIAKTDELKKSFAEKFIILPNAIYGEWETELYPDTVKTPDQMRAARYQALRGF